LALFDAAVDSVQPAGLVSRSLEPMLCRLPQRADLVVIGAGKAASSMVQGLASAVQKARQTGWEGKLRGVVAVPRPRPADPCSLAVSVSPAPSRPELDALLPDVETVPAGHPLPDDGSARAAERALSLTAAARESDHVVALLSGGASAMLTLPVPGVSLEELRAATAAILQAGLAIHEANALRKHLSMTAGGRLGQACPPARVTACVVSDVVGDDLSVIGSAPFFGDESTFGECLQIVRQEALEERLPPSVLAYLARGARGGVPENPRPGDPSLSGVAHLLLASNLNACRASARAAGERGYPSLLLSHLFEGEARELGRFHASMAVSALRAASPMPAPCALVSGGEATVRVRGAGVGGRNQETVLAAAAALSGLPVTFLSAGTDGIDGVTDAAGGLVDGSTCERAAALGLDVGRALRQNDSGTLLAVLGDQVLTGPTGTNVADVRVVLVGEPGGAPGRMASR
jgi:glycerate-2-kinase